jgi:hypothetical protein
MTEPAPCSTQPRRATPVSWTFCSSLKVMGPSACIHLAVQRIDAVLPPFQAVRFRPFSCSLSHPTKANCSCCHAISATSRGDGRCKCLGGCECEALGDRRAGRGGQGCWCQASVRHAFQASVRCPFVAPPLHSHGVPCNDPFRVASHAMAPLAVIVATVAEFELLCSQRWPGRRRSEHPCARIDPRRIGHGVHDHAHRQAAGSPCSGRADHASDRLRQQSHESRG